MKQKKQARPLRAARKLVPVTVRHHKRMKAESKRRKAAGQPDNKLVDVLDEALSVGLGVPVPVVNKQEKGN